MQSKDIKEIIKIGLILCVITAVAAGLLSAVNGLTAPIIAENNQKKQDAAMARVLPGAASFDEIDISEGESSVTGMYKADNGYVVLCSPNGYGGAVSMVVGVNDGTVTGVDIIGQSETAGLGANCTKEEFKAQFTGKSAGITVSKNGAKGNEIDAISSATITSKAVTKGVNDALEAVAEQEGK